MKGDKILSLFGAVLIPAPLMITSLASVYRDNNLLLPMLIWWLGGVLLIFLGRLTGSWVKSAGKKAIYAARITAGAAGVFSAVFSVFFVYLTQMTSLAYMFMPGAAVFWYWFGYKFGLEREIITNMVIGGYCLEAVFLFPMCSSLGENSLSANIVIIISAAVLVVSTVLINRRQLVRLAYRGKNETAVLSKDTRRFNLKLTLIFSAIILIPFFFARWGGKWLWEILKAIIQFLLSLFVDIGADADTQIIDDSGSGIIEITANNGMWFKILMAIMAIIIVIILAKPLVNAICRLIRSIKQKLGRLENESSVEAGYIDFYETSEEKIQREIGFKKTYRSFLKEKELTQKYRLGYKAFMIKLKELGEENLLYDTTTVHCEKGSHVIDRDSVERVIDKYEQLRYSDRAVTEEDCSQMELMLRSLSKVRYRAKSADR
ncbi:MAG: hypothetical protein HDT47_05485 [Ruminococcaceae bacterium]|nr:hypothetical protein [Oscillospiraceae bacterium]